MQEISFVVPGSPVPWQRMGRTRTKRLDGKGVRTFKARKVVKYQDVFMQAATAEILRWRMQARVVWRGDGDFSVALRFYRGTRHRVDVDNLAKTCLDAMSGSVYDDDWQVVELHAYKEIDTEQPRCECMVRRC